jgi:hypothetical protein
MVHLQEHWPRQQSAVRGIMREAGQDQRSAGATPQDVAAISVTRVQSGVARNGRARTRCGGPGRRRVARKSAVRADGAARRVPCNRCRAAQLRAQKSVRKKYRCECG